MAVVSQSFKEQRAAILEWFCKATGLPAVWRNSKEDHGRTPPQASITLNRIRSIGVDEVRRVTVQKGTPPADVSVPTIFGNRQIQCTLRVRSRDQRDDEAAWGLLEAARATLKAPWAQAIFRAGCVSVVDTEDVLEIPETHQGRIESVALLDLVFGTVIRVTDARDEATTIEQVEVSSDMQPMVDGLQLDKELIP